MGRGEELKPLIQSTCLVVNYLNTMVGNYLNVMVTSKYTTRQAIPEVTGKTDPQTIRRG